MTYRACSVDVYQADEEAEDDREEWDCTNYENWIVDHYSELADSYQQVVRSRRGFAARSSC